MVIPPFRFDLPVDVRFGDGVAADLAGAVAELGGRRPVAVVEQPLAATQPLAASLAGIGVVVKPAGEPTVELVERIRGEVQERRPDVLIAIGGGSALDVGKAVRAVLGRRLDFSGLLDGTRPVELPTLPLIAVPTTSGTGSEVSGGAVMADPASGRKLGVASPLMRAQIALVDPLLTAGLPATATMATGVDALAQAIGAVTVRNGSPASVALGLEACRVIAGALAAAVHDGADRAARSAMSLGSLTAGLAMNLSDCGADHALGHASGAVLHLPHGLAVGLTLAEALDVTRRAVPEPMERVADALGEPPGGAGDGARAVAAVRRLLSAVGFPSATAAGMLAGHVQAMTALALDDYCLGVDAYRWTAEDVRGAFAAALSGTR
ncbi:MAG TPA: iron-containing alcohol dehydrogenase [Gaiellales bacterium]|nr:iron-containing alcohol dehydrogenase [Gaiellales bacterium]